VERINQQGAALVREYHDLSRRAQDTSLTPEVRGQAEAAAQAKADQVRKRQQELRTFVANTRQSLEQRVMTFEAVYTQETGEVPRDSLLSRGGPLEVNPDPAADLATPKFGLENKTP
jgi:outer membrane protein